MTQTYHPAPPSQPASAGGLAITALVLGIIALLLSIIVIGGLLAVVSLILGIVAWVSATKNPARTKGVAIAATIISALAVLLAVVMLVVSVVFAGPFFQKGVAMTPSQEAAGRAVEAAIQGGADPQVVTDAAEEFDQEFQRIVVEAPDADAAKQQAEAALQELRDKIDALPQTGGAALPE